MALPTDLTLAKLQLAAYQYPGGESFDWTWRYQIAKGVVPVAGGVVRLGETQVVVLPGTTTPAEWGRDFRALPDKWTENRGLGPVHWGFYQGLEPFVEALAAQLGSGALIVQGHSLGAAEAALVTGLLQLRGVRVDRLVCFAPPKPAEGQLAQLVAGVPKALYRNKCDDGWDFVTDVPFSIPIVAPFCHVGPLTDVKGEPAVDDPWGPFHWHHMALYVKGLGG